MRPSAGVTESGLTIYDLENSELTYEKKNEVNVGIDMGFLNNPHQPRSRLVQA